MSLVGARRPGLALGYREYSSDYVDEEAEARQAKRGAWRGAFVEPWDWRRNPRQSTTRPTPAPGSTSADAPNENAFPRGAGAPSARPGCLIKGNINRRGDRIYHVPGSRSYDETIIDEARGEGWFCTEQEALDAGWRAPRG